MRIAVLGLALLVSLGMSAQSQAPAGEEPNSQVSAEAQAGMEKTLGALRSGVEGGDARRFFSAFDGKRMDGFLAFKDAVGALLNRYDPIRLRFQIVQVDGEGTRATATVELQMDATPRNGMGAELRRDQQLRFVFEKEDKWWKIVDVSPREFFAVTGG